MSSHRRHWSIPFGVARGLAMLLAALGTFIMGAVSVWGALSEERSAFLPLWAGITLLAVGVVLLGFAFGPAWSVTAGRRGVSVRRLAGRQFIELEQIREIRPAGNGLRRRIEIVTHKGRTSVHPLPPDADGLLEHLRKSLKRT